MEYVLAEFADDPRELKEVAGRLRYRSTVADIAVPQVRELEAQHEAFSNSLNMYMERILTNHRFTRLRFRNERFVVALNVGTVMDWTVPISYFRVVRVHDNGMRIRIFWAAPVPGEVPNNLFIDRDDDEPNSEVEPEWEGQDDPARVQADRPGGTVHRAQIERLLFHHARLQRDNAELERLVEELRAYSDYLRTLMPQ